MRSIALALVAITLCAISSERASAGYLATLQVSDGSTTLTDANDFGYNFVVFANGIGVSALNGPTVPHTLIMSAEFTLPALAAGQHLDIYLELRYKPDGTFYPEPVGSDLFSRLSTTLSSPTGLGAGISGSVGSYVTFDSGAASVGDVPIPVASGWGASTRVGYFGESLGTTYYQQWHIHLEGGFEGGVVSAESVYGAPAPAGLLLLASGAPLILFARVRRRLLKTP